MTEEQKNEQIQKVLALLSVYRGRELADDTATRKLSFIELGLSSLTLASMIVELEDRLDRQFDFTAFGRVKNVGDLLRAIDLA